MRKGLREALASSLAGLAASVLARGWGGSEREALAAADLARARDALKEGTGE